MTENEQGVIVKTSGGLSDEWTYRRYQHEDMWAYQPIRKPDIGSQDRNPVDVLLDQRLASVELAPALAADPRMLIRRLTFDLLGLPPKSEEVQAFLAAWSVNAEQAWSALVDRLLASPHYGEQAARH